MFRSGVHIVLIVVAALGLAAWAVVTAEELRWRRKRCRTSLVRRRE
jgi:hypothetical protein